MNKLDALWQYQQAELEADKLENKLKSTPARQKLNKLFNLLKDQQPEYKKRWTAASRPWISFRRR